MQPKPASTLVALLFCLVQGAASAQQLCEKEDGIAAMTLTDIYAKAAALAQQWQADAQPLAIGTSLQSPLREDGSSDGWTLRFASKSAQKTAEYRLFRGAFSCYESNGVLGRIPELKPDFTKDGAALYAKAKKKAGKFLDQGHVPVLSLTQNPVLKAAWYVNLQSPTDYKVYASVIMNANNGKLLKYLKHKR